MTALTLAMLWNASGAMGGVLLASVVVGLTLGIVILVDMIPGALGRSHPRALSLWALRMLRVPYILLYPVTKVLLVMRSFVRRILGEEQGVSEHVELETLVRRIFSGERPAPSQRQLLMQRATGFPDVMVREVMVPRTDMVTISEDMNLDEILEVLLERGHSRLPAYGETLDEIVGIFYAKDVIHMMASGEEFDINQCLRRPHFVAETKAIDELLEEFQRERVHMAIVVDEFGGTAGLITLEDIMEEFFGDIQDEYDLEPPQLVELGEGRMVADARIGIDELEDYFGVTFPDDPDYDSLGGFLLVMAGNVPEKGEEIRWENLLFRIQEADAKRIDSVEIEVLPEEPAVAEDLVS